MVELLKKFWEYLKPHLVPILLFCGIVSLALYGRSLLGKERDDFVSKLKTYEALRDEEVKKIVAATEEERMLYRENLRRYEETMDAIRQKYLTDTKKLEETKTTQVKKIVEKFNEDPTGAAKQISELTGLKLVIPEN